MKRKTNEFIWVMALLLYLTAAVWPQTTAFNYQGKLTEAGNPATGNYQMQFKLFDTAAAGTQIGSTISDVAITISQGIFSVKLDFGANALIGANRWLEIGVRHNSGESYTTLAPREQIASSPYAVRTLSAQQADLALDSNKLGGILASEYVTNAALNTNFIRNQTTQQAGSNFNISGNGTIGGSLNLNGAFPNGLFLSNGSANFRGTIVGNTALLGTTDNSTSLSISTNNGTNGSLFLTNTGNIGINTIAPNHRLTIDTLNGPSWTNQNWGGAIALRNSSAIGWQLNSSNLSFGIGQSTDGLSFFRTTNSPGSTGNTPSYDLQITNQGNVGIGTTAPNAKLFVQGEASNGFGIAATGNASQSLSKGGWVKAMMVVNPTLPAGQQITRCFNSQGSGTGVTTPPCGFTATGVALGSWQIGFPFEVSTRFGLVTTANSFNVPPITTGLIYGLPNNNSLTLQFGYPNRDLTNPLEFTLIVF